MELKYHFRQEGGHHETPLRRIGANRSNYRLLMARDLNLNIKVGARTKFFDHIFKTGEAIAVAVSQVEVIRGSDVPSIPTGIVPKNTVAVTGMADVELKPIAAVIEGELECSQ